jgi:hypothetical protein
LERMTKVALSSELTHPEQEVLPLPDRSENGSES